MSLNIYLTFDGNCREAFEFYRSVFGGDFADCQTFGEGPGDADVPKAAKDLIMHVSLPVADAMLMGSDAFPGAEPLVVGTNFSVSLAPDSRAQCDELFAKLSDGGTVTTPLQEMFWGAYFGSLRDRFDVNWMLNFELS